MSPAKTAARWPTLPRRGTAALGTTLVVILVATSLLLGGGISDAATLTVDLETAEDFSILAETAVTGDGTSQVELSLGVSAGTITGFTPGQVGGTIHQNDAVAVAAADDLTAAYNDAFTRPGATTIPAELAGQTLTDGTYRIGTAASLGGVLILDGLSDPNSVFIIQIVGALGTTATVSSVSLINDAQACNVFWAVSAAVTIGAGASFAGNVMATGEITTGAGVNVDGRLLSVDAAVTAPGTAVTNEACLVVEPTTTTTATTTTTTTATTTTTIPTTTTTLAPTTTTPTTTTTTTTIPETTTTVLEVAPTTLEGTTTTQSEDTTSTEGSGGAAGSTGGSGGAAGSTEGSEGAAGSTEGSAGLPATGSDSTPAVVVAILAQVAGMAMVRVGSRSEA